MIIKDVRTTRLKMPWVDPPKTGLREIGDREYLIVEMETRDGMVGMGFLQPLMGGTAVIEACIHQMLKPLLIGQDATHVERLWQLLYK